MPPLIETVTTLWFYLILVVMYIVQLWLLIFLTGRPVPYLLKWDIPSGQRGSTGRWISDLLYLYIFYHCLVRQQGLCDCPVTQNIIGSRVTAYIRQSSPALCHSHAQAQPRAILSLLFLLQCFTFQDRVRNGQNYLKSLFLRSMMPSLVGLITFVRGSKITSALWVISRWKGHFSLCYHGCWEISNSLLRWLSDIGFRFV